MANQHSDPIPLFKVHMAPEVGPAVLETLYSGYLTQGERVDEFEAALQTWLDVDYVLTVNSGTSALQLALTLAHIGYGDLVVSTPMTCTATNTAIRAVGADIVWADIDPVTGNIDPESVRERLEEDTEHKIKGIMAVDWAGQPCNWSALRALADRHNVALIEDAAHAFGATYNGCKLGQMADFTCYSLQAIKHLTTGDGGVLVCRDYDAYARGKLLRWFGIDRDGPKLDMRCEENVVEPGWKYHMNDLNATIGLAQLPHVARIVEAHRDIGLQYDEQFRAIAGDHLWTIPRPPNTQSAYWVYTLHVDDRRMFMDMLKQFGITSSRVHSRNDTHTMFEKYQRPLPGLDTFDATQINIPCGWWLSSGEVLHIVRTVEGYVRWRTDAVKKTVTID